MPERLQASHTQQQKHELSSDFLPEQLRMMPASSHVLDSSDAFLERLSMSLSANFLMEISGSQKELQRPQEGMGVGAWMKYFDTNWEEEGLPHDWEELKSEQSNKRVGFVMDQQMNLLKDAKDKDDLSDWVTKTTRDLEGFKLEFLSDNVVYPRKYVRSPSNPKQLEDPLYGKAKDGTNYAKVTEMVSADERNGSVKDSIEKVQEFFSDAPDDSLAVMASPLGPTGFKTKDGLAIDYPDSYFFIMQKNGDEVMNYTVKTDFKLQQCREVVAKLTGKELPENASLEHYVRSLALIKPGQHEQVRTVDDVISLLENVQPDHAFVDKQNKKVSGWDDVRDQTKRGEELYNFDQKTSAVLSDFREYAEEGVHTKEDLQKAIAATILRLGELFFDQSSASKKEIMLQPDTWYAVQSKQLFGAVLEQTAERRGCSGGGGGQVFTINTAGGVRSGVGGSAEDEYGSLDFECTKGHRNTRPRGQLISNCVTCGENVACE